MSVSIAPLVFTLVLAVICSAEPSRLEEIKNVLTERGYVIPEGRFLSELQAFELKTGLRLSPREVIWRIQADLSEAGTSLKSKKPRCFTCAMRVLTPKGYQALEDLRAGDEVYSWDIRRGEPVINQIVKVVSANDQLYGKISNTPTQRSLEVTPDHPFFLPTMNAYQAIALVDPDEKLLGVSYNKGSPCESLLLTRGTFEMIGVEDTMTLSLKDAPHNYIVEGYVVENKPIF